MPEYRRWREPGATYFFSVVTYRRRPLFYDSRARRILRESIAAVRTEHPIQIFASVLLPDHVHCIWIMPPRDDDFSTRWSKIKRLVTTGYLEAGGKSLPVSAARNGRRMRGVWQPRYWEHLVRSDEELVAYRDYIHLNPVKHGYVRDPADWPWSSVHRHVRLGWLEPNWAANPAVSVEPPFD